MLSFSLKTEVVAEAMLRRPATDAMGAPTMNPRPVRDTAIPLDDKTTTKRLVAAENVTNDE